MPLFVRIIAKFVIEKTGKPIVGKDYIVKIFDKDLLSDDLLGEASLDNDGTIHLLTDLDKASSIDTPLEFKPDVYFVVYYKNKKIFKSKVFYDVDFLEINKVTKKRENLTRFFGEFKVI